MFTYHFKAEKAGKLLPLPENSNVKNSITGLLKYNIDHFFLSVDYPYLSANKEHPLNLTFARYLGYPTSIPCGYRT